MEKTNAGIPHTIDELYVEAQNKLDLFSKTKKTPGAKHYEAITKYLQPLIETIHKEKQLPFSFKNESWVKGSLTLNTLQEIFRRYNTPALSFLFPCEAETMPSFYEFLYYASELLTLYFPSDPGYSHHAQYYKERMVDVLHDFFILSANLIKKSYEVPHVYLYPYMHIRFFAPPKLDIWEPLDRDLLVPESGVTEEDRERFHLRVPRVLNSYSQIFKTKPLSFPGLLVNELIVCYMFEKGTEETQGQTFFYSEPNHSYQQFFDGRKLKDGVSLQTIENKLSIYLLVSLTIFSFFNFFIFLSFFRPHGFANQPFFATSVLSMTYAPLYFLSIPHNSR